MMLLQLTANTGPEECCLAVRKALAQLLRDGEAAGVRVELLEQVDSEVRGNLRSVLLALEGEGAAAVARRWSGSLLWICASPYRPRHGRKNWFIGGALFDVGEAGASSTTQTSGTKRCAPAGRVGSTSTRPTRRCERRICRAG